MLVPHVGDLFEIATNFALAPPVLLLFDIAHFILCCIEVRNDSLGAVVRRKHPLACLVACVLVSFAGGLLANFLLGLPVVGELSNTLNVALVIACWYLIFYSPMDICYRLATTMVFKIPIVAFKELGRARKVSKGIAMAASIYPESVAIMFIIGIVKGSGSGFMRIVDRVIRGVWNPQINEFLYPSFATKITVISCVVLLAGKFGYIKLAYPQLVFVVSLFMVYAKVAVLLLKLNDPIAPIERFMCRILIGKPEEAAKSVADETNPANSISRTSTMQSGITRPKAD